MKLLPALILCAMLAGCSAFQKKAPPTNFDAPTARLDDVRGEASSISVELNESTTHLNADADSLDTLVNEGRALVSQLADYWNRLAKAVQKVRDDVPKGAADRQVALVTKIASVQQQVNAGAKEITDLKAENAKLKDANRPNTKGYLAIGLFVFFLGVIAFLKFDKQAGVAGMAGGGVYIAAGIFLPSLIDGAPYLIYGLYALAGVVIIFFVYRAVRVRIARTQTATGAEIFLKTLQAVSPPQAALATLQLKSAQDKETSQMVDADRAKIDKEMLKREVAKAAVVSALPAMTQATLATPALDGATAQQAGEATVVAGAATVTGPVVGSG